MDVHSERVIADLVDLVLPRRCIGCSRPGPALCRICARGRPIARPVRDVGLVHAAGPYALGLRRAVLAYKERDRRDLAPALSGLLRLAVEAAARAGPFDVVVPVPSRRGASRARGGDHLIRLLKRARLGWPTVAALQVVRRVVDSAGLDAVDRRANVTGAFALRSPGRFVLPSGSRVLIVDDIVTTGATLREAARALQAGGFAVSGAAVIGATARRPAARVRGHPSGGTDRASQRSAARYLDASRSGTGRHDLGGITSIRPDHAGASDSV